MNDKLIQLAARSEAFALAKAKGEGVELVEQTCDKHGAYKARKIVGRIYSNCPTCKAESDERLAIEQQEAARKASEARTARLIEESGIPHRYQQKTLKTLVSQNAKQDVAFEFAKQYAEQFDEVFQSGRSAIFLGSVGTGKTHAACGIGIHILGSNADYSVRYTTVMRAMRSIKDTFNNGSTQSEREAIEQYTKPSLLILDEVGVQFGSDFERNMMFDILNERYENQLPTLFMSNLTKDEVTEFLGERVMDRIREDGGKVVPFAWESYRGKK